MNRTGLTKDLEKKDPEENPSSYKTKQSIQKKITINYMQPQDIWFQFEKGGLSPLVT